MANNDEINLEDVNPSDGDGTPVPDGGEEQNSVEKALRHERPR